MGQVAALAGVSIRTGSSTGERVLSGLMCKIGEFSFISDNAGCFSGKPFPVDGFLMTLWSFITYIATEPVSSYPTRVVDAEDPPAFRAGPVQHTARPRNSVGVMMAGSNAGASKEATSKGAASEFVTPVADPVDKRNRGAKFPKEEPEQTGTFTGPLSMSGMEVPLEEVIEKLDRPVAPSANVELTIAELEAERLRLQKEARLVMETRIAFDRDLREYNAANGITRSEERRVGKECRL